MAPTVGLYLACYPELEETWSYVPPLGLGYLASYARHNAGLNVDFVIEREIDDLIAHKPDLVCMTFVTHNEPLARIAAQKVKEQLGSHVPVVIGGPHISTLPTKLFKPFDVAVLHEGEETFAELLRLWLERGKFELRELAKIQGLLYRDDSGATVRTAPRPAIENLDTIPFPDRDLMFDKWRVDRGHKPVELQIMTSRGCPYGCSFCSTIIHWGRGFRYPTNEYVVNEIAEMRRKFNPTQIHIYDDLYVVRKDRVMEINRMLRERGLHHGVEFTCFVRSNLLDEELMQDLARTNFKILHIGFESGSDEILLKFNKQAADMRKNRDAIKFARNAGLEFTSCFILGAPGERREDIYDTFEFVTDSMDAMKYVHITPLMIFPGTKVWEWAEEKFDVSADKMEGVVMDQRAVEDGEEFLLKRIPYFNEENIPREEFNTYLKIGWRLERVVTDGSYLRGLARRAMSESYDAKTVAERTPLTDIVREKARRRLKKIMPVNGDHLDEVRRRDEPKAAGA